MTSAKRDIFIGLLLLVGGIFLGGGNEQIFGWWGGGDPGKYTVLYPELF